MANVTFQANPQPAPACYPSDVNGLLQLAAGGGLSGTVPDNSGGGIFAGSSPPSSSLTNKVWFKTDGAGRPLGVYMFYNGNWRKVYTGVGYGEVRMYTGAASVFDGSGRGIVTGDFDGWCLCNGGNGTPNLIDRFIVSGSWNGSAWTTNVDGRVNRTAGGAPGPNIIRPSNLPQLSVECFASGTAPLTGGNGYCIGGPTQLGVSIWPVIETQGSPNTELPLPYFYTLAFMMFVGYQ
jgi:hypothetical protein